MRDCEGWESMRANLTGADLFRANLTGADLRVANLYVANLSGADLYVANLSGANLYGANLYVANLSGADLSGANLSGADLSGANLRGADLYVANLRGANLRGADLYGANLRVAKNIPFIPYACPDFGMFVGFKQAKGDYEGEAIKVLVTLEIPEDAKRLSATGRKCRCDKAKVLRITDLEEKVDVSEAYSMLDDKFIYRVGEVVAVDNFDEYRWNECSTGIHFFINKQEAIDYLC